MKKINIGFLVILCLPFLISCQKELTMDSSLSSSGGTLQGTWKFMEMRTKTESVVEISDGIDVLKTITLSDYTTTQNTGTLVIDASKVVSTGFGYEVNAIAKGYIFENSILIDSVDAPFTFTSPPANSSASYTRISADSVSFGPGFMSVAGSTTPTSPTGAKVQLIGDKMLMTVSASRSNVQTTFGITQTKRDWAQAVMTYQR